MQDNNECDLKLAQLPDNLRTTVELIHQLYQQGENVRYKDIRDARLVKGMTEGSDATLAKAKKLWREIYQIESVSYDSPDTLKQLIERSVGDIRDSIKAHYQEAADVKVAEAEDALTLAKQQLEVANDDKTKLQEKRDALVNQLERQKTDYTILETARDDLIATRTELEKDLAAEKVNYTNVVRDKDYLEQQLTTANKALDDYKAMAERQRQDQLVLLDNERTRANRLEKEKNHVKSEMQQLQKEYSELKAKYAAKQEAYERLERDKRNQEQQHKDRYATLEKDYQTLQHENHQLALANTKKESDIQSLKMKLEQQPDINTVMKSALKEMQQSMEKRAKNDKSKKR